MLTTENAASAATLNSAAAVWTHVTINDVLNHYHGRNHATHGVPFDGDTLAKLAR